MKVLEFLIKIQGGAADICNLQQVEALGMFMKDIHFDAIYTSNLKRCYCTAIGIQTGQTEGTKPCVTISHLLRKQSFGIAEGHPRAFSVDPNKSLAEHYAEGKFPILQGRGQKFPGGESVDDLAQRANRAIEELILPVIFQAASEGKKGLHLAVVSHGLCLSEVSIRTC